MTSPSSQNNCYGTVDVRVKAAAAVTVLLLAISIATAAAQTGAQTEAQIGAHPGAGASSQRARSTHSMPQPRPLPLVLPEQFAPPQETYASFPDSGSADAPPTPSACQLRLAKVATFLSLGTLIGPGDCGAADAVQLQAVVLPDQTKVALTPPATLRCTMAEQVAGWLRDDVAPTLA